MSGRFAPSPTGRLHLGTLRTAVLAWLSARAHDRGFLVRMEDLDRVQAAPEHERSQLLDLAALGLDHDVEVVRQSERFDRYHDAIETLRARGLVYDCFCTRREVLAEIDASASAPHLPPGAYPGTCRRLSSRRRAELVAEGRTPALRLSAVDPATGAATRVEFVDAVAGPYRGGVDDVVLRRNDGVPAYNLAVVVDDAAQGVSEIVRGDDLISSTPRQIHLQRLLGVGTPLYGHVPLVLADDGTRLAKRHGAVTLGDLTGPMAGATTDAGSVLAELLRSIGLDAVRDDAGRVDPRTSLHAASVGFELAAIPHDPVVYVPVEAAPGFELRPALA